MKKCVIYARYSSEKQNEQSIQGQVDVCTKWIKAQDMAIVDIYHDEAMSGKTDRRPDFQKMIHDAEKGKFDFVVVYKLDRFARNRYDSAIYKAQLKKCGVKVLSAMEQLSDGAESIILESVLEGMAEYYSANLAQNVIRGMHQRAEQGKYLGGNVPLGYVIDKNNNFVLDEKGAATVRKIFEMYVAGKKIKDICTALNSSGHKTSSGSSFGYNSIYSILTNRKYIGWYEYMGVSIENGIDRIVTDELFASAGERLEKNKKAPAKSKSNVNFYLTGKLFCGLCGNPMVGDSGTGKNGTSHYYYSCVEKKRKHNCTKKNVKKEWIEETVVDIVCNQILKDDIMDNISKEAYRLYEAEKADDSELKSLNAMLKETETVINNIMKAIEQGIITDSTKERLMEAEARKKEILLSIAKAEIKKPDISEEYIRFYLEDIRDKVFSAEDRTEAIIDTFVNAVYLYDDKLILTFNLKDGEGLKKLEFSDLSKFPSPSSSVFGFSPERFTITILSELFIFGTAVKIRRD